MAKISEMYSCKALLPDGALRKHAALDTAFAKGPWLVVSPHDDDLVLGMGLTLLAAHAQKIEVHAVVVSDGRMGYVQSSQKQNIVATRQEECRQALKKIGLRETHMHFMGFPDGQLEHFSGCDPDKPTLGRALTQLLRRIKPGCVFAPTENDLHPDHRVTSRELEMACCWASSRIWLDLGKPIALPKRFDYAVYSAFPQPPDRQVLGDVESFRRKQEALRCFESQDVIEEMVARLDADGAQEYFLEKTWQPYRPSMYEDLFVESESTFEVSGQAANDFAGDYREVVALTEAWPAHSWAPLREALAQAKRRPLLLIGEGSSRLFPGRFLRYLARHWGHAGLIADVGGREAATLPLEDYQLCFCSNSGATKEVLELAQHCQGHDSTLALIGSQGSPLGTMVSNHKIILTQPEKAVPATKSVIAQTLTLAHALADVLGESIPFAALSHAFDGILQTPLTRDLMAAYRRAQRIWWVDNECGVASELALKTMEVTGVTGHAAEGSLVLHGIEEILTMDDLIITCGIRAVDEELLRERILNIPGVTLRSVGVENTDWQVPDLGVWTPCLYLAVGWRMLEHLALEQGRDPARPLRVNKIGNPYTLLFDDTRDFSRKRKPKEMQD
jgi:LmbE family N-acetylglucosaminyl deacetylase/fructoselysine-6-P-deglycase FrlB-like protein